LYGSAFAITFAVLSTVGQIVAYRFGIRPTINYAPAIRPRGLSAISGWQAVSEVSLST